MGFLVEIVKLVAVAIAESAVGEWVKDKIHQSKKRAAKLDGGNRG